ncbi:MAG: hypothetical protein PVSMB1_02920 [Gemmatimonadaceae bacterium]
MCERGEPAGKAERIRKGRHPYPTALSDLRVPPTQLFAIGNIQMLDHTPDRSVAIVGTRDASSYGVRVASELAGALAATGICVVSGMARGIDSAAHRGALRAGGHTVAVLGSGVDVPYPATNRALHQSIVEHGLVLSEYEPGTRPGPGSFPRRNRIIAALARVTIVVEAPYKSGAINTASQALELGRVVAAVPGPIDSDRSAGANLLLRDGAQVIATVEDALGLFGEYRRGPATEKPTGDVELRLWTALASGAAPPDVLGRRTGLSVRQVLEGLARLELTGLVRHSATGDVERL